MTGGAAARVLEAPAQAPDAPAAPWDKQARKRAYLALENSGLPLTTRVLVKAVIGQADEYGRLVMSHADLVAPLGKGCGERTSQRHFHREDIRAFVNVVRPVKPWSHPRPEGALRRHGPRYQGVCPMSAPEREAANDRPAVCSFQLVLPGFEGIDLPPPRRRRASSRRRAPEAAVGAPPPSAEHVPPPQSSAPIEYVPPPPPSHLPPRAYTPEDRDSIYAALEDLERVSPIGQQGQLERAALALDVGGRHQQSPERICGAILGVARWVEKQRAKRKPHDVDRVLGWIRDFVARQDDRVRHTATRAIRPVRVAPAESAAATVQARGARAPAAATPEAAPPGPSHTSAAALLKVLASPASGAARPAPRRPSPPPAADVTPLPTEVAEAADVEPRGPPL